MSEVFVLGWWAFAFKSGLEDAYLCEHCRAVIDPPGPRVAALKYLWVALALVAMACVLFSILWYFAS